MFSARILNDKVDDKVLMSEESEACFEDCSDALPPPQRPRSCCIGLLAQNRKLEAALEKEKQRRRKIVDAYKKLMLAYQSIVEVKEFGKFTISTVALLSFIFPRFTCYCFAFNIFIFCFACPVKMLTKFHNKWTNLEFSTIHRKKTSRISMMPRKI